MKKFLRRAAVVILVLLALLGVLLFFKDAILKTIAESRLRKQTGLEARIGQLKVGLGSAKVVLKDFKLINTAAYGGGALVDIPELHLELDPAPAAAGKLRFKLIRFHLAELNVVRGQDGRINLEELSARLQPPASVTTNATLRLSAGYEFGGIKTMHLTLHQVNYTDLRQPRNNRRMRLGIEDEVITGLNTEEDVNNWLASMFVRIVLQEYLRDPGKSKAEAWELFFKRLRQK